MPSGGHGGGGGSHFGGGRSGGSRGGSGGGGSRRNVPMVFWFFGRRYYIPLNISNKIRNLLTLAFVTAFVFVCGMLSLKTEKARLNTIVYDHDRYVKMIEFAKENPEYRAEGTITDIRYNGDVQKYYLLYRIPYSGNYGYLEGFTYSVYSSEDIHSFRVGQTLTFAVDRPEILPNTDSINFGYENIPLSADGEYAKLKKHFVFTSVVYAIAGGVAITAVVFAIVKGVQNLKEKQSADDFIPDGGQSGGDGQSEKPVRCKYCGAVLPKGAGKCPCCGASKDDE